MYITLPRYSYHNILKDAAKVQWQVNDLIGEDKPLDFTKPFLPEAIARVKPLICLHPQEQLTLNQIRGNSYLHLFGLLEEFILPLVVNHVQTIGCDDIEATQAYLGFAKEESKHIHLFRQFAQAFAAGFGSHCGCIGPPSAVADFILQHSSLGVALVTLHIEWMTQHHFLSTVRDNHQENLDHQFCNLLRHHWQEEAQHARLDALIVQSMAQNLDAAEIEIGINDYIAIIQYLNAGLMNQVQLDINSLERAINRRFSAIEREMIQQVQATSYQQTFLISGMTHPNFVQIVQTLSADGYNRIAEMMQTFS